MPHQPITPEQSGAFIEQFTIAPTRDGALAGLTFAVKDLIDVTGHRKSCGNPTWLETHPPAVVSAVAVDQLLAAGAQCAGKTVTDEVAFSLLGQNHFHGTPLNPAAPDRVPGGSSSGSGSAVACGHVDFALGTDTGGSVRIPANNCGVWGLRPSHGRISVAGVMPLAPTYDTVGILARDVDILHCAAKALLGDDTINPYTSETPTVFLVEEAFDCAEPSVRNPLQPIIESLQTASPANFTHISLGDLCNDRTAADLATWLETYRLLSGYEIASTLGAWIADSEPTFGPFTKAGFDFIATLDRSHVGEIVLRREHYCRRLNQRLSPGNLLCFPTSPMLAPLKDPHGFDRNGDYYRRTLGVTAISGVSRLPEVTVPVATFAGVPVGLSFAAAHGEDNYLLDFLQNLPLPRPL